MKNYDLIVVGGGISGVAASVSAAKESVIRSDLLRSAVLYGKTGIFCFFYVENPENGCIV